MTREELKEHCEKQIENCEMWARCIGEEPHGKIYEEHKLILELLEQEPFKPIVEIDLYSVIKQKYIEREVLDKIIVEIRKKMRFNSFNEAIVSFDDISKIFDECMAESENEDE